MVVPNFLVARFAEIEVVALLAVHADTILNVRVTMIAREAFRIFDIVELIHSAFKSVRSHSRIPGFHDRL